MRNRVAILHGVNFDALDRRPSSVYGDLSFAGLERAIGGFAHDLGLVAHFFQSNFEGEYVEELHKASDLSDALVLNPGAWTHYSWAIRDALEIAALPAVEVHLSDVGGREEFRRASVVRDLCVATVTGQGVEGYRVALSTLSEALQ